MIDSIENGRKEDGNRSIADKIIKRLHDLDQTVENNQGRWAWELLKNAKDSISDEEDRTVSVQILLNEESVEFKHNGTYFSELDIRGLINQISSKVAGEGQPTKKTGRFGTGFLTTHLLSLICLAFWLTGLPAYTVLADTLYVTLEKDNALAVVDGATGKLTKTVKIGKRPRGIVLSKDQKQLYIAASDDNTLQIVDTASLKVVGKLPSDKDPESFAMDPKGEFLYVSNEDDNLVTVIDIAKRKAVKQVPVGVEPEGIAVSPDGQWVVSTSETTNMAHWIDRTKLEIIDNTLVDPRPRSALFTADGKQLWVSSEIAGNVSVFDVATRQLVKKIGFKIPAVTQEKIQPVGMRIDKNRRYAYVALGPSSRVAVIDAQTLEVVDYYLVGQRVWNLEFSPDEKKLYTVNGLSNDISIIDLENRKVVKSVPVGQYPWGVAVKP